MIEKLTKIVNLKKYVVKNDFEKKLVLKKCDQG